MQAGEVLSERDGRSTHGYCPRCRREVELLNLQQVATLTEDTPGDHVVILPGGEVRVCLGSREPTASA